MDVHINYTSLYSFKDSNQYEFKDKDISYVFIDEYLFDMILTRYIYILENTDM